MPPPLDARHTALTVIPTLDPKKLPEDYSLSFPWVYLIWFAVVLLLYFPCRWFGALKRRWPGGLLSYL